MLEYHFINKANTNTKQQDCSLVLTDCLSESFSWCCGARNLSCDWQHWLWLRSLISFSCVYNQSDPGKVWREPRPQFPVGVLMHEPYTSNDQFTFWQSRPGTTWAHLCYSGHALNELCELQTVSRIVNRTTGHISCEFTMFKVCSHQELDEIFTQWAKPKYWFNASFRLFYIHMLQTL